MLTRIRPLTPRPTYPPAPAPAPAFTPDPADIAAEAAQHLNALTTHIPAPAPATASPIAAVLAGALHLLETRGWAATGRTCRNPTGALCLLGALRVAAGSTPNSSDSLPASRAAAFLLDIVQIAYPNAQTIPSWNDGQPTAHQPLAMLRLAGHRARILGI
ncbi:MULTISPECIES: DUF6197 family protein [unclassified Streptomyces]|uniref:DUF6197 family protein n=1 Tax=unclassified Streptomyces TaxID=2593676 RepID=UPI00081B7A7E|nr:hypothetical protein [Streptomyces sp. DvalAA-43]MYQ82965.1 hypothetical protein [Streptomyces sp. SID4936]SCD56359.1 hypothetical protein GA0115234_103317 [Streptomyces sp. DvalAA-43]